MVRELEPLISSVRRPSTGSRHDSHEMFSLNTTSSEIIKASVVRAVAVLLGHLDARGHFRKGSEGLN